jgi:hypothetical protein
MNQSIFLVLGMLLLGLAYLNVPIPNWLIGILLLIFAILALIPAL